MDGRRRGEEELDASGAQCHSLLAREGLLEDTRAEEVGGGVGTSAGEQGDGLGGEGGGQGGMEGGGEER